MKRTGTFNWEEVKYDKVWWKKKIKFPDSYTVYEFKIVELNKEFYIFIEDRYPYLFYSGRKGAFKSFEEAKSALEEDLGSNFPSLRNKTNKSGKTLLALLIVIPYLASNVVLFLFVDGGLNALGISDDSYLMNGIIMLIYNYFTINKLAKLKI